MKQGKGASKPGGPKATVIRVAEDSSQLPVGEFLPDVQPERREELGEARAQPRLVQRAVVPPDQKRGAGGADADPGNANQSRRHIDFSSAFDGRFVELFEIRLSILAF